MAVGSGGFMTTRTENFSVSHRLFWRLLQSLTIGRLTAALPLNSNRGNFPLKFIQVTQKDARRCKKVALRSNRTYLSALVEAVYFSGFCQLGIAFSPFNLELEFQRKCESCSSNAL